MRGELACQRPDLTVHAGLLVGREPEEVNLLQRRPRGAVRNLVDPPLVGGTAPDLRLDLLPERLDPLLKLIAPQPLLQRHDLPLVGKPFPQEVREQLLQVDRAHHPVLEVARATVTSVDPTELLDGVAGKLPDCRVAPGHQLVHQVLEIVLLVPLGLLRVDLINVPRWQWRCVAGVEVQLEDVVERCAVACGAHEQAVERLAQDRPIEKVSMLEQSDSIDALGERGCHAGPAQCCDEVEQLLEDTVDLGRSLSEDACDPIVHILLLIPAIAVPVTA